MNEVKVNDLTELIENFPYQPLFNKVIITLNKVEPDGGLNLSENILSDVQYILAKGGSVSQLSLGDKVLIDIEKLMVEVRSEASNAYEVYKQVKIDPIEVDGETYAIVEDRVIKAIINENK